ncbi:MAG: T9SS type A sorting domain-containing protein [Ignavibacteriae bacterium]|nr:T9SS type A sorting domain-containing protein [Ignavibacteriota bacterium]
MDSLLFAATSQGVYVTSDAGSSWSVRSTGMTAADVRSLCVVGSKLLAGTVYGGVFMSTDKGANWSARNTSLNPNIVYALLLSGSTVVAGSSAYGVWVSRSDTIKWSTAGTGFTLGPTVNALASDGQHLYAGIEGQGVWRRALSEVLLDVNDGERTTPLQYTLEQNFPNPFNPSTTIRFSLPVRSSVRIIAYSMLGQEVATIFNGTLDAGIHSVPFDGSRLSSGVYFCRMQSGAFQSARSMLLVR